MSSTIRIGRQARLNIRLRIERKTDPPSNRTQELIVWSEGRIMLPIPTEDFEQTLLVHWLEAQGYKFTAIPNSTYTTSIKQKMKNKRTGLRAGFPDLGIIVNNKFICIEMKRTRGGTVTPEQKTWIEALNNAGVPTRVCKGFLEAKAFVNEVAARDDDMWPEPLPRS